MLIRKVIFPYWYVLDKGFKFQQSSKSEAINLLENADFSEKSGSIYNISFYCHI